MGVVVLLYPPLPRIPTSAWYTVAAGWSCRIKRSLAVRQRIYGCRHELGAREPAAPPGKHAEGPCGLRHAHAHDFGVPAGPLELCSTAAQQAHVTGSQNRRMPARILADGRPRAQVQYQITARLRELQRRGAHGEHLDARDCAQWPTVEAQVCRRSRCPLAVRTPLTRSAHPRTTHPLNRTAAQGARRLLREVWHDRLHELVVRNNVGRDHEHPAHSASVQRRRLGVWRLRRAAASLLVSGCVCVLLLRA